MPAIFGANTESAAYEISNSLRFHDGDSAYLSRTVGTPTNEKIYTVSVWVKKGNVGVTNTIIGSPPEGDRLVVGDRFEFFTNGSADAYLRTNRLARDTAAWYHVVLAYDTTQSTAANRVKLYVNGTQETWDLSTTYPSEDNTNGKINKSGTTLEIGHGHSGFCDGYMADFYLIDGQALDASYFGETDTNGVWIPKEYDGTYGNNGFLLQFGSGTGLSANSSGMGADTSGNDNHLAAESNMGAHDVTTDTPTNNFLTMNPLYTNSRGTFREGNTQVLTSVQGSAPYGQVEFGNFAVNKGKWYYEAKITSVGSGGSLGLGWNERAESGGYVNGHNNGGSAGNVRYNSSGVLTIGSSHSQSTGVDSFTDGDIIGFALDLDNNKVYCTKNGAYQDDPTPDPDDNDGRSIVSAYNNYWTPWMSKDDTNHNANVKFNFGNPAYSNSSSQADDNGYGDFEYDVPTGYYALCSKNLAEFG